MPGLSAHLILVLLTPCLWLTVTALALWLWPQRWLLRFCLAVAWMLALMQLRLIPLTDEFAGPMLIWLRPDALAFIIAAVAMPALAFLVRGQQPWRCALGQACLAGLGLMPLPLWLAWSALSLALPWRWSWWRWLLVFLVLVNIALWPLPFWADVASVGTLIIAALGLQAGGRSYRIFVVGTALMLGLTLWRLLG